MHPIRVSLILRLLVDDHSVILYGNKNNMPLILASRLSSFIEDSSGNLKKGVIFFTSDLNLLDQNLVNGCVTFKI